MKQWYYADNNQQNGPIPESQLIELLTTNKIPQDTPVWAQGMAAWTPANITELAQKLAQTQQNFSSQPIDARKDSDAKWYYALNGQQTGPVSENEILLLVEKGTIPQNAQVWTQGMPNWVALNQSSLKTKISVRPSAASRVSQHPTQNLSTQQRSQSLISKTQASSQSPSRSPSKGSNIEDSYLNCEQFDVEKLKQSIFLRPVSPIKLAIYSFCSLGLYTFYWFFKNFQRSEGQESGCIAPFFAAIFSRFTIFILTNKVAKEAENRNVALEANPQIWSGAYLTLFFLGKISGIFLLYDFIPLIFLQRSINKLNEGIEEPDSSFSILPVLICIPGGIFHLMVLYGVILHLMK